ncbi:hypothetical protein HDU76_003111, partial [Blyttiomyces sp. JEL0837]
LAEVYKEIEDNSLAIESFRKLRSQEEAAAVDRVESLKQEVRKVEERELLLQQRYQELTITRDQLLAQRSMPNGSVNGH